METCKYISECPAIPDCDGRDCENTRRQLASHIFQMIEAIEDNGTIENNEITMKNLDYLFNVSAKLDKIGKAIKSEEVGNV